MQAVSVSWTFASGVRKECARSGSAGRYMSSDNGPNMESAPNIRSNFTGARFELDVTTLWKHSATEDNFAFHLPVSLENDSPPV